MQKILLGLFLLLTINLSSISAQSCDLDFEDWETASNANPPAGWQRINSYVGTTASNAYSGSTFAGMNTLDDQWIVEPLTCPGEICFYWRASGASSNYDVAIDWSTDNGDTWTNAHTIILTGSGSPTTYSQLCVDLPESLFPAPFEGVLIRFHHERRSSGSFYFDDICVSAGTCNVNPTQLTFSNLQAGCLAKNTPFSISVCATDSGENIDETFAGAITVSGSGLSGTTSLTAVNGCAQFTDLALNAAGSFTLSASDGSLIGNSNSITIEDQCATTSNLTVVAYNLLNFPNGRDDCGASNTVIPARWDTLKTIMDYIQPDILMVCELQTELGADMILSNALNTNGNSNYARADFVLNQSPGGTVLNNAFYYNTDKVTLYSQDEVATNVRDIGEYIVYVNDPNLATHNDTTFIDFYSAHLKAGSAAADESSRSVQCSSLQNHTASKGEERNAVIGGDFNFYTSTEAGYQTLLSSTYPFNDPINTPGSWNNNASFTETHTQATRPSSSDPMDCGATGGVDSRFDFLLNSNPIMNGTKNVQYISGSYTPLGNDGNLFNDAINDNSNNSGVPNTVLSALFHTSDHLPVIMDLEVSFPLVTLPIDLLYFDVRKENKQAVIEWEIANTNDLDYFILQKSMDSRTFLDLATFEKQTHNNFSYVEELSGGKSYYRLKSVELDGTNSYSELRSITNNDLKWNIFPNPIKEVLNIQSITPNTSNVETEVRIFDTYGHILFLGNSSLSSNFQINTSNWSPGIYIIEIKNGNNIMTRKIVK